LLERVIPGGTIHKDNSDLDLYLETITRCPSLTFFKNYLSAIPLSICFSLAYTYRRFYLSFRRVSWIEKRGSRVNRNSICLSVLLRVSVKPHTFLQALIIFFLFQLIEELLIEECQ